jgi:branched-subunit amino acid transport protein
MSLDLVALALLMGAVTYPWRVVPLLLPGIERLPSPVLGYLRLIGPAALSALAAVSVLVVEDDRGVAQLRLGVEALAVVMCIAVVAWRRNLFLGVALAVVLVAGARYLHLA